MVCVITRFHLRHFWQLIAFYHAYRYMKRDLQSASGLIRYTFLLESPYVCYTLSIWESEQAMMLFNNTSAHLRVLRRLRPFCRAIWSADWHTGMISKSAQQWPGLKPWPAMKTHTFHPNRLIPNVGEGKENYADHT
jgi:hypothetical protein